MKLECEQIIHLIDFLKSSGNDVAHISRGWAKMSEVYHMKKKLTAQVKSDVLKTLPLLEYWAFEGSPDLPADEGFFCKSHKVAVSFPVNASCKR